MLNSTRRRKLPIHSIELVTYPPVTRQERLKLWLWKTGISQADIARKLEVSKASVGYWIRREQLSAERVAQLREFGIPEELLPEAKDIPGGPKPSLRLQNEAAATT